MGRPGTSKLLRPLEAHVYKGIGSTIIVVSNTIIETAKLTNDQYKRALRLGLTAMLALEELKLADISPDTKLASSNPAVSQ